MRLRVNEGNLQKWPNSRSARRGRKTQRQLDGVKHESRSSRYLHGLWSWSRAQKVHGCRAMRCEVGHLRKREQICQRSARQPVNVERRDFDAGGGGCHRPARLRRKRGHPSNGAALAEVFTATGSVAEKSGEELP